MPAQLASLKQPLAKPLAAGIAAFCALVALAAALGFRSTPLPTGFVYVADVVPDVVLEMRYFSTYNFTGARVPGYDAPVAILTSEAADALKAVAEDLREDGYIIKVWDAYRPQRAVDSFVVWAVDETTINKDVFYPDLEKNVLFPQGYIAEKSSHTRGSTVDLTIMNRLQGKEVDMGSPYDFFGVISHPDTDLITDAQKNNRLILKDAMEKAGFKPYDEEWWHYTLKDEPYPDTYFDFVVR